VCRTGHRNVKPRLNLKPDISQSLSEKLQQNTHALQAKQQELAAAAVGLKTVSSGGCKRLERSGVIAPHLTSLSLQVIATCTVTVT
jgi:hypothetical protein